VHLARRRFGFGDVSIVMVPFVQLVGGRLVVVQQNLIRRQKQHFVALENCDVDLILGLNGFVWVAPHVEAAAQPGEAGADMVCPPVNAGQMENVARVARCIQALAALYFPIYPASIADVYELSLQEKVPLDGMLDRSFLSIVASLEVQRRASR
jgi:exosome complex component RRP4